MTKTEPTYVTPEQAAEFLNCSSRTIRRMIAAGEFTGYRLGKRMIRIDLREVEAWATAKPV